MANSKVEKAANGSGIARRFGVLALCFALVTGLLGGRPAAAAAAGGRQSFFHSVEVRSANIAPFTKWRSAIARTAREVAREQGRDCSSDGGAGCRYRELDAFLDTLRG